MQVKHVTILIFLFILFVLFGKFVGIPFVFSEGERTGLVTKISKKGFIFKTWEGSMNLGGMITNSDGNTVPNIWQFSVKDEAILEKIQQSNRNQTRITIVYDQYLLLPYADGSTNYLVKDVYTENQAERSK